MKEINLLEILRGHEGETFYSPLYGDTTFRIFDDIIEICPIEDGSCDFTPINKEGYSRPEGEMLFFPSKDQRDWSKWIKEQALKAPKTWNEVNKSALNQDILGAIETLESQTPIISDDRSLKSVLAFLKIHQLIETGYGGNIRDKEWSGSSTSKYAIFPTLVVDPVYYLCSKTHIAFHTKEQAVEFLKYPENIQLLKDYFMINE